MSVDIFSVAKPQGGEFFKFKIVGDAIQGTYIDVRTGTDSFQNQQTIYVIQSADGKVWNVAFRDTAVYIHERMSGTRFGQIVGFRFDEERESKKNPGTKAKIIRIYADPKQVDHAWLEQQAKIDATLGAQNPTPVHQPVYQPAPAQPASVPFGVPDGFEAPADATPASGAMPTATAVEATPAAPSVNNDAVNAIRLLAKTKGLTNDSMSQDQADAEIEGITNLSLSDPANHVKIIVALTSYSK